ncbi:hypothetical protein LSCM1_07192 [Leishmania martiniquensis]|uniref:Protein kinase domain-containing protein n=1 Tax=Leishmania martiniquensis TaxID=1580590 RepID=A0A836KWT2_9TRYP|nr:hypothetical protein LSCM1_07192 [Leishmania martiniquensis]
MNNSILLLGGCVTTACDIPVGESEADGAASRTATAANSPYHEHIIALNVEKSIITALPRLTLPEGLGFAGRYAAVTLTDSVYVARSCTMSTHSADDISSMTAKELQAMQAAYAPVVAFYPEGPVTSSPRAGDSDLPAAVNLTYFVVPTDRVRVNASCTALATENKLLIIGGFLLSEQRATASVDSFDVVTRKYEADLAFLSRPVLQPSVAASTGFAAVAGGWTYDSVTTANAAREAGAPQEAIRSRRRRRLTRASAARLEPLRPVAQYMFDLLFFDPDRLTCDTCAPPLRVRRAGGGICRSPVDASTLPHTVVEDILLSPSGCHVAVFGGQVVLTDHNLSRVAVVDVRAKSASGQTARVLSTTPPPPLLLPAVELVRTEKLRAPASAVKYAVRAVSHQLTTEHMPVEERPCVQASCLDSGHAASIFMSTSTSSSAPPREDSAASSSSAAATSSSLSPTPEYRYAWMQPTLIPLSYTHRPAAADAPDLTVMTDTILIFYALGGEDVWEEVGAEGGDDDADVRAGSLDRHRVVHRLRGGTSTRRGDAGDADAVVRREAARRWAQRNLPDVDYDGDRPELLALTMPTPVWPDSLTLKTNSEGIIHLTFPDVNYSRYCTWKKRWGGKEDDVACSIRLSSRRDCVGNTAGTLDSAYDGTPNVTILFSASGSTTPVYVCFSYVVQPTSWPRCRMQQSFSILNPMMPLRILDNSPTTPAPTPGPGPSPTRDPADKTTSSPLFMLAVSVAVVTLLVAVLLVARLQHVPDDGLLVMSLFERGGSAGSPQAGAVTRSISSSGTRRSGRDLGKRLLPGGLDSGDGSRRGLYDWPRDGQGAAGSRDEEPPKVADSEDNDAFGLRPMETYADFLQVVEGAEEEREARMLATAADVLRLHQHRYRVLSRIGQGAHSLCFLALRKVPAPILAAQQQKVRGADAGVGRGVRLLGGGASSAARAPPFTRSTPFFPPVSSTSVPGLPTAATALVSAAAATVSSLWSARHDQNTAVVVKYTQCPDDATRAVITRMCERLRDLQVDTITEALGAKAVHGPHRNTVPSRHHHRWQRPSEMYSASAATDLRSPHTTSRRTRYIAHEGLSGTGSSDSSAAVAETPEADAGEATAQPASMRGSTAATITTAHPTGCKPLLPPSFLPEVARVHAEDAEEEDGSCAWLDAHEVNVVLSLFLMLPEDLFVSYEVSVLQQHRSSGRLAPRTVSRAMVEWNRRHVWPGWSPAQAEALHHPHLHECTPTLPTQQGFLAQFTPRVCWAACVNPLQPSTISPWSLCLVMPYERNGNLADFISRCRHVQLLPAGVTNGNESKSSNASSSQAAASSHLGPVHYCWTESLLCSLLFQVCTGLQLLHAQSPPILHGNIKPANVLLRAPASFSVARRRVVVAGALAPLAERRLDVSGDPDSATFAPREPDTQEASEGKIGWRNSSVESGTASAEQTSAARTSLWHAGGLVAAAAAVWHAGSPVLRSLPSLGSTPPLPRGSAAAPLSTAARSLSGLQERQRHPPLREHGQVRPQDLERRLLSTHTYLPISLTDGGMSWWLTVQLPLRLRGCFGRTTRSTLRQTPAGLCWLRRSEVPLQASPPMKSSAVPSDNCIAALAYFLFTFIEVPTHIAPELLWGQLCTMSQPGHGEREGGSVGAPAARGWSPTQPPSSLYPTRSRREQYARTLRRDDRRYRDGDSVVSRRCGDVTREPAQSPTAGSAKHVNAAPSDELSVGTAEDKQGSATLSPESRQEGPYADEDMDDRDVDLDVDEDGIFTGEEVSALTSAMWKAEGLTRAPHRRRYDRRAPPQQRAVASAGAAFSTVGAPSASAATPGGGPAPEEATQLLVDTNGAVGDGRGRGGGARGLPSSVSDVSLPANPTTSMRRVSPILSLQPTAPALHPGLLTGSPVLASPCSTLHHHHHDMGRQPCGSGSGGRRMTGGGASVGGGGSRGSSGVYELLIQRVLAMDTASDVWSLGLLLYEMLADSVDGQHQQQQSATFTATTMSRPPHSTADYVSRSHAHRDGAHVLRSAMPTCSGASRLAQRAFAALLGDLYDLAVAGVPSADHGSHRWSCGGNGGAQSVGGDEDEEADAEHFDKAADERLRWPRSCALEDEVMQVVCNAGYTRRFASTLARMLSPVSARRPSAGDIVNDLRVVVAVTTATAALRSMRTGGSSFADEEDEYRGAEHTLHERTDHRGSAGDDIASAVVLSERTARMALRR